MESRLGYSARNEIKPKNLGTMGRLWTRVWVGVGDTSNLGEAGQAILSNRLLYLLEGILACAQA